MSLNNAFHLFHRHPWSRRWAADKPVVLTFSFFYDKANHASYTECLSLSLIYMTANAHVCWMLNIFLLTDECAHYIIDIHLSSPLKSSRSFFGGSKTDFAGHTNRSVPFPPKLDLVSNQKPSIWTMRSPHVPPNSLNNSRSPNFSSAVPTVPAPTVRIPIAGPPTVLETAYNTRRRRSETSSSEKVRKRDEDDSVFRMDWYSLFLSLLWLQELMWISSVHGHHTFLHFSFLFRRLLAFLCVPCEIAVEMFHPSCAHLSSVSIYPFIRTHYSVRPHVCTKSNLCKIF